MLHPSNVGARDFEIVTATRDAPQEANWRHYLPERDGRLIETRRCLVVSFCSPARHPASPRRPRFRSGEEHEIGFGEETYSLQRETIYEFDTSILRFSYSSLACSRRPTTTTWRRGSVSSSRNRRAAPYDSDAYSTLVEARAEARERADVDPPQARREARRIRAAVDPRLRRLRICGSTPASPNRFSLVDRGFVFALAHVRGGTEKGWRWYEAGKLSRKPNTFRRFHRRRALSSRMATPTPAASSRRAAAPAAC